MSEVQSWLTEFGERQAQARFPAVYWLSLLLLLIGTVALLWSLPVPEAFREISPALNWGTAFLMAAAVYYFIISLPLGSGMILFVLGVAAVQTWLAGLSVPLAYTGSVITGVATAGLFFGHYGTGGIFAVLRDIQLVMIAPAWALSRVYRRLGIPV
jgi:hypothetical protein